MSFSRVGAEIYARATVVNARGIPLARVIDTNPLFLHCTALNGTLALAWSTGDRVCVHPPLSHPHWDRPEEICIEWACATRWQQEAATPTFVPTLGAGSSNLVAFGDFAKCRDRETAQTLTLAPTLAQLQARAATPTQTPTIDTTFGTTKLTQFVTKTFFAVDMSLCKRNERRLENVYEDIPCDLVACEANAAGRVTVTWTTGDCVTMQLCEGDAVTHKSLLVSWKARQASRIASIHRV